MPLPQPIFHGLSDGRPLNVYWRNLPHWRQEGAAYFVTFRLGDSIPASVLRRWDDERCAWLQAMGVRPEWKHEDPERYTKALSAIPAAQVHEFQSRRARQEHMELDRCHGLCVLRKSEASRVLVDALRFFDGERWWLGDFVVMPNHVHLIALPGENWPLEDILGSVKKYAARRIEREAQGERAPFWQQESYDRIMRDAEELAIFRRYIADNPAKAGLREGEFVFSRAAWLDKWAALDGE